LLSIWLSLVAVVVDKPLVVVLAVCSQVHNL
jgi:hypothetical protein